MTSEKKMLILQQAYAGVLADSVKQLGIEGVLDQVTARKKQEQLKSGGVMAAQLGITTPAEVLPGCPIFLTVPNGLLIPTKPDLRLNQPAVCLLP